MIPPSNDHSIHHTTHWEDSSNDKYIDDNPPVSPPPAPSPPSSPHPPQPAPTTLPEPPPLRRSSRTKHTPDWLYDYVTPIANSTTTTLNAQFHCFMASLHEAPNPVTFHEASKHPQWVKTMNEQLAALEENNTWVITDLPLGKIKQ